MCVCRRAAGQHGVLDVAGHVGRGLHLRGDAVRRAHLPRRPRHARPARENIQGIYCSFLQILIIWDFFFQNILLHLLHGLVYISNLKNLGSR